MRIQVTRTGGFAGIERHATLDTAGRPDAARLHTLAAAALTRTPHPGPHIPDGFHYRITADDRTVECWDPHVTPPQRELIQTTLTEGA